MKKNFILDTNVLLHEATAIQRFKDNHVIIPLKVIEELDHFKKDQSELGRNARHVSRLLDDLRQSGKLNKGVNLPQDGTLRIAFPGKARQNGATADEQILDLATEMQRADGLRTIIITKDINLRLKADALGLDAEDYESDRVDIADLYTGHTEHMVSSDLLDIFRREGRVAAPNDGNAFWPNQYVLLRHDADQDHTVLVRFDGESKNLVPLIPTPDEVKSVQPRNKEQHYAMDALLNDNIKVVTIVGKAGTGKTLLAVAAAIFKTMYEKRYRRMLICRPTVPMGKDIGFLPGTLEEKLTPWMQPIYDAMDFLSNGEKRWKKNKDGTHDDDDRIGIEPLTYIRGRSIPNQFIVVDEAQNLTPLEAKTVLTRVGPGTKIVLTGDIYQIDNPFLDSMSNGLSAVVEKFRPHNIAANIVLGRGVRSEVAELAANLL